MKQPGNALGNAAPQRGLGKRAEVGLGAARATA
jgi:hypothetical protein